MSIVNYLMLLAVLLYMPFRIWCFTTELHLRILDSKIVIVSFIVLKSEIIQPYFAFFIYDTDRWCILISSYIVIAEYPHLG